MWVEFCCPNVVSRGCLWDPALESMYGMKPDLPLLYWCEESEWSCPSDARNGRAAKQPSSVMERPSGLLDAFGPVNELVHRFSGCGDLCAVKVVEQSQNFAGGATWWEIVRGEGIQDRKETCVCSGKLGLGRVFMESKGSVNDPGLGNNPG